MGDVDGEVGSGPAALPPEDPRERPGVLLAVLQHEEGEHRDGRGVEEEREDRPDLEDDARDGVEHPLLEAHRADAGALAVGEEAPRPLLDPREEAPRLRGEPLDLPLVGGPVAGEGLRPGRGR